MTRQLNVILTNTVPFVMKTVITLQIAISRRSRIQKDRLFQTSKEIKKLVLKIPGKNRLLE